MDEHNNLEYEKQYRDAFNSWREARIKSQAVQQRANHMYQSEGKYYHLTDEDIKLCQSDYEKWQLFLEIVRDRPMTD